MVFWGILGMLSALAFAGSIFTGTPPTALTDLGGFSGLSIAIFAVTNRLGETIADLRY